MSAHAWTHLPTYSDDSSPLTTTCVHAGDDGRRKDNGVSIWLHTLPPCCHALIIESAITPPANPGPTATGTSKGHSRLGLDEWLTDPPFPYNSLQAALTKHVQEHNGTDSDMLAVDSSEASQNVLEVWALHWSVHVFLL